MHELAVARLAVRIERDQPGVRVLTEREGRRQEATRAGRCSVDVLAAGGRRERRWPDLIVEAEGRRVAIELELAAKTTQRLRRIVVAYAISRDFTEVRFLVGSAALAARLESLCAAERRPALGSGSRARRLEVAPWPGASAAARADIQAALARVRR